MGLTRIREERNLSVYRLSKMSGITQTALWAIERDGRSPTLRTLGKLAAALNLSITELIDQLNMPEQKGA